MRCLALSLLLLSCLNACGRSSTDIYRAYNGSSYANNGDLAARNRQSFQDGSHSGYFYISPQTLESDTVKETPLETDSLLPDSVPSNTDSPAAVRRQTAVSKTALTATTRTESKNSAVIPSVPEPVYRQAPAFELEDLQGKKRVFAYPLAKPTVMAFADQKGAEQMEAWITPLYARYGERIEVHGVAELSAVPGFARGIARGIIGGLVEQPIMLDWTGKVSKQFGMQPKVTNIYLLNTQGQILVEGSGLADLAKLTAFVKVIDPLLKP